MTRDGTRSAHHPNHSTSPTKYATPTPPTRPAPHSPQQSPHAPHRGSPPHQTHHTARTARNRHYQRRAPSGPYDVLSSVHYLARSQPTPTHTLATLTHHRSPHPTAHHADIRRIAAPLKPGRPAPITRDVFPRRMTEPIFEPFLVRHLTPFIAAHDLTAGRSRSSTEKPGSHAHPCNDRTPTNPDDGRSTPSANNNTSRCSCIAGAPFHIGRADHTTPPTDTRPAPADNTPRHEPRTHSSPLMTPPPNPHQHAPYAPTQPATPQPETHDPTTTTHTNNAPTTTNHHNPEHSANAPHAQKPNQTRPTSR
jgi:hypothetical protein